MRERFSKKWGFTLIEVMIASTIFLIMSFGIMHGMLSAIRSSHLASEHYRATCICRNRIQRAKTENFDAIPFMRETNVLISFDGTPNPTSDFMRTTIVDNLFSNLSIDIEVRTIFSTSPGKINSQPVSIKTKIFRNM